MDISSYVTVLPIVIICYLVGIGCKASKKISDKTIPVIVGIVGGIVAVPAMYVMKSFPAEEWKKYWKNLQTTLSKVCFSVRW